MLHERARRHFLQLGWDVEVAPTMRRGPLEFKPDLVARRGNKVQALRIDEDALGAYQIGSFAALCLKFQVQGVIVCPGSPEVLDECRERGVDFLSPEGLGEAWFPAPAAPTPEPIEPPAPPVAPAARVQAKAASRAWRWFVVAVIWLLAIYFSIRFAQKVFA